MNSTTMSFWVSGWQRPEVKPACMPSQSTRRFNRGLSRRKNSLNCLSEPSKIPLATALAPRGRLDGPSGGWYSCHDGAVGSHCSVDYTRGCWPCRQPFGTGLSWFGCAGRAVLVRDAIQIAPPEHFAMFVVVTHVPNCLGIWRCKSQRRTIATFFASGILGVG